MHDTRSPAALAVENSHQVTSLWDSDIQPHTAQSEQATFITKFMMTGGESEM